MIEKTKIGFMLHLITFYELEEVLASCGDPPLPLKGKGKRNSERPLITKSCRKP